MLQELLRLRLTGLRVLGFRVWGLAFREFGVQGLGFDSWMFAVFCQGKVLQMVGNSCS